MDDQEKQSIKVNQCKRYGSTTTTRKVSGGNETLIKILIDKTDTLQGISLKYGCTVSTRSLVPYMEK
jgi:hypothetical protein